MDKILNWFKGLDLGTKISYGVLVLALLIAGLIFSSKNKATTQQVSNNNLASSNKTLAVTPTKIKTDFDTESDDQVVSVTPKVTSGVSSNIITPSKSLIPTATIIPTLTPIPTVTLIPTITPTATITPTPKPTSTPTNTPTPTVTPVLLGYISLSANDVYLYPGEQQKITVYFDPDGVTDKNLSWTYNSNIVDIAVDGLITAKSEGKTNVVVKASNNKSTLLKITVSSSKASPTPTKIKTSTSSNSPTLTPTTSTSNSGGLATDISVNTTSLTLTEGSEQQIVYSVVPSNASNKTIYRNYDGYVINVDENGLVTAKNVGTATITLKTSNGITRTISVVVKPKPTNTPTPTPTATPTPMSLIADPAKGALTCNHSDKVVGTNQCSAENARLSMNASCSGNTVCANGCGLVSVSIILQGHNPKNTPKCLLTPSMGCRSDFFTKAGACPISWTSMSNTLISNLGKSALYNSGKKFSCNKTLVKKMLCTGWVLIVHIRRSDGTGHWLVAAATTSTGDVALADPSYSGEKFNYWSNMVNDRDAHPTYCLAIKVESI